jgi:hypothetical protein
LAFIEEPDKSEHHRYHQKVNDKKAASAKSVLYGTAKESLGNFVKWNDIKNKINGDWVHTDPNKGDAPFSPAPDFDYLIEDGEEETSISTRDQHIRRAPDLLYYRELQSP